MKPRTILRQLQLIGRVAKQGVAEQVSGLGIHRGIVAAQSAFRTPAVLLCRYGLLVEFQAVRSMAKSQRTA
jgi:hypothetical protein